VLQRLLILTAAAAVAAALRKRLMMIVLCAVLVYPFGLDFLGSPSYPALFGIATVVYAVTSLWLAIQHLRERGR
jgi:hypothetical protein